MGKQQCHQPLWLFGPTGRPDTAVWCTHPLGGLGTGCSGGQTAPVGRKCQAVPIRGDQVRQAERFGGVVRAGKRSGSTHLTHRPPSAGRIAQRPMLPASVGDQPSPLTSSRLVRQVPTSGVAGEASSGA